MSVSAWDDSTLETAGDVRPALDFWMSPLRECSATGQADSLSGKNASATISILISGSVCMY